MVVEKSEAQENAVVLSALASGVPVVCRKWFDDMERRNKLLPMERYLLVQNESESHDSTGLLFDEMRIELVGTSSFRETYGRIVREGGGKVVDRLLQGTSHDGSSAALRVDVVVAEEDRLSPNSIIENAADAAGVPLVSTRWLIDSIKQRVIREDAATMAQYRAHRTDE